MRTISAAKLKEALERAECRVHNTHPIKGLSRHLVGKHHSLSHKLISGGLVMMVGVSIAKLSEGVVLHYILDLVGYAVHGIGLTPWIEGLIMLIKDED